MAKHAPLHHRWSRLPLVVMAVSLWSMPSHAEIKDLPVPVVTIYPNDTITGELLTGRKFKVTQKSIAGIATRSVELIGMQARRRLPAGWPVALTAVRPPIVVKRGAPVSSVYSEAGLLITGVLVALKDGSVGDMIDARNPSTGIVVHASVQADGTLLVLSP